MSHARVDEPMICQGCGTGIVPFTPRYAGRERHGEYWHYDCWASTADGSLSIARQNRVREMPKPRSRKAHIYAKDEHCPDGLLCNGWRLVRHGEIVLFGHRKHQHALLESRVGDYVYCEIADWTGIEITVYPHGLSGRGQPDGCICPEVLA